MPRKLVVVLHADVVGYSRLVGEDESATHRRLKQCMDRISGLITAYHGRVANTAGDAILAKFEAVVDAVSCALAIQSEVAAINQDIADNRKLVFRIGVHLGDVIEDGADIFGDGVNVAARLEGLAEPGGICISEQVFMAVSGKLAIDCMDMGPQSMKNIAEPIRVYQIFPNPNIKVPLPSDRQQTGKRNSHKRRPVIIALIGVALAAGGALTWLKPWQLGRVSDYAKETSHTVPDKPSIVVLPFANLSSDIDQEFFADGVTEDIISGLSRFSELFVIAKRSAFSYKEKSFSADQIAEELGVEYILEGSLRRTQSDLVINTQLIDAKSGTHIWAEKYNRPLQEFHAIQSDLLSKIISTVAARVENLELRISAQTQTENLNAYEHVLQGYQQVFMWSRDGNRQAREHFYKAIELDPNYSRAYSGLAFSHNMDFSRGLTENPSESLELAKEASLKAIELDDTDNRPRITLGWALINEGDLDRGINEIKTGIALNPNDADVLARSGYALIYYGEFQQAIDQVEKAMQINPFHPDYYYDVLAWAQYFVKRYDEALKTLSHVHKLNNAHHRTLAATYARVGNQEKAQFHAQKILEKEPDFTLENYKKSSSFKDPVHLKFHIESLSMAGLP